MQLQDVCVLDRKTVAASEAIGRGLGFVGMEHVNPVTGAISKKAGSRTGEGKGQAFLFDERHVLFGKLRPYLKKIALPEQAGCSSTELVPLLPDAERLDRKYLYYWVRRQTVIDALMDKNTGARMPRADMKVLLEFEVNLPSLEEQRSIVAVLDRAAAIRLRVDEAKTKARALVPALFAEMFGDPLTNPKSWPETNLGSLIATGPQNGLYRPSEDYGSGTRILRIDSFDDGTLVPQKSLRRLEVDSATINTYCLLEGDLVINRVNSPPQLGKSVVIGELEEDTLFESNMMRVTPDRSRVLPVYLGALLQLPAARSSLVRNAKHAINQSSINQKDVKSFELPLPPMELQIEFRKRALALFSIANTLDFAAFRSEKLTDSMATRVFV